MKIGPVNMSGCANFRGVKIGPVNMSGGANFRGGEDWSCKHVWGCKF